MVMDTGKIEQAVKDLLIAFGEDVDREGLKETPRRVAGYWEELLEGMKYSNAEIAEMFSKKFITASDPLVVKEVKNVFSHCEHHLALMYNMTVVVAYIPKQIGEDKYEVIGLSKIPRIVDLCSKRLQLQEKLAQDIAECISLATGSEDVFVNIKGDHACVSARGAKSDGFTDVTYIQGMFRDNPDLRNEIERKIRHI
jgi:GTP cyclohydrolase I